MEPDFLLYLRHQFFKIQYEIYFFNTHFNGFKFF